MLAGGRAGWIPTRAAARDNCVHRDHRPSSRARCERCAPQTHNHVGLGGDVVAPHAVQRMPSLIMDHAADQTASGNFASAIQHIVIETDTARSLRHNNEMIDPAGTALIAVDVQADFLPGGALGVPGSDAVVAPIRALASQVGVVVATRDFHPPGHCSFIVQGGPWPPHCVIGSPGAALHPDIDAVAHVIVSKGDDPALEQYSGFDGTGLGALLRARRAADHHRRHRHRLLRPSHSACGMRRGLRHHRGAGRRARGGTPSGRRRSRLGGHTCRGGTTMHASRDPRDRTRLGARSPDRHHQCKHAERHRHERGQGGRSGPGAVPRL